MGENKKMIRQKKRERKRKSEGRAVSMLSETERVRER